MDFETRSDVDIGKHGAHVYFESPNAKVLMCSFRLPCGGKGRWRYGEPCPQPLIDVIAAGGTITGHNVAFEILCFQWLHANCGWPAVPLEQFRCTAATAAAMQLPRSLEKLGEALGLALQKDREGKRLIRKFSIPQDDGKFIQPEDDPEDFERFHDYCDVDVEVEVLADSRMVPLSAYEQSVYTLSERINQRGIRIDVESARAALRIAARAKDLLDAEMAEITGGAVRKCSEVAKLTAWLEAVGVPVESLKKADIDEVLDYDDLPQAARSALLVRQEAAKTSVAKIEAMLKRASKDGRVRGSFMYHGAGTGRWVSKGVNFANLPRTRKCAEGLRQDLLFDAIRTGDPGYLRFAYGDEIGRPLHLLSDAIRGLIWAAPGHDLIQADYSNIEGVVVAWTAGEEWKLAAFREVFADPDNVPDLYRRTAAGILNLPLEAVGKKHWGRQAVGKPAELGLGYQGGVNAFYTFARNYGVNLRPIAGPVLETATAEALAKAERRFLACHKRNTSRARELGRETWMACEIIKNGWRAQNPEIAQSWKDLEAAVRSAVENPGEVTEAARVKYVLRFGFLWALLPSGRCLAYGSPRLKAQVWAEVLLEDGSWSDAEVMDKDAAERGAAQGRVRIQGDTSDKVTVMGVDSNKDRWVRYGLYGGIICENNTQAIARDILVNGMFKAEAAGYPIIAHVYDEMIAEIPRGFGSLAEFERVICDLPPWAEGLPIAAGGWRGKRYRKD